MAVSATSAAPAYTRRRSGSSRDPADREQRRRPPGRRAVRRSTVLHPGDQLARRERLGDVVVGAELQARAPGRPRRPGRSRTAPGSSRRRRAAAGTPRCRPGRAGRRRARPPTGCSRRIAASAGRAVRLDVHAEALPRQVEPDQVGDRRARPRRRGPGPRVFGSVGTPALYGPGCGPVTRRSGFGTSDESLRVTGCATLRSGPSAAGRARRRDGRRRIRRRVDAAVGAARVSRDRGPTSSAEAP